MERPRSNGQADTNETVRHDITRLYLAVEVGSGNGRLGHDVKVQGVFAANGVRAKVRAKVKLPQMKSGGIWGFGVPVVSATAA
jgi:hypothetical protein